MSSQYPKDEFDVAGEDMPIGVHRPQPSKWKNVWPFLVIIVVVPLLAWGASALLVKRGVVPTPQSAGSAVVAGQSGQQAAESDMPQSAPQTQDAPAAEETPAEPEKPEQAEEPVNHQARIAVLNGTGVSGLAAEKVTTLTNAGFTGASAANADGWQTAQTTVYYAQASLEATAKAVASELGISHVEESSNIGDTDIVVILR
ncbi:LytR C-terminal domain-containing protein [Schaalia sp. ZJ405]|uniref:LytR C-terminal domain-containing protein n=1 Tax=Schaalia sp. ZJ405 TaxID=2709403 RepID=UPI0013EB1991|nr:LytR C-terminal domain-containing protein [Schaalia sp. ZJ405]QPK81046.1 LytR C-terminal domain-containing protein [Schaalia sp. ZJ405]